MSYITATMESEDGSDRVDLRIHYTFRSGASAMLWGDHSQPEDPEEVEAHRVEIGNHTVWRMALPGETLFGHHVHNWAERYLADNIDAVAEDVAANAEEAAAYRAELRADR